MKSNFLNKYNLINHYFVMEEYNLEILAAKYPHSHWGKEYLKKNSIDLNKIDEKVFQKIESVFKKEYEADFLVDYLTPKNEVQAYLLAFNLLINPKLQNARERLASPFFSWLSNRTSRLLSNESMMIILEYFEKSLKITPLIQEKRIVIKIADFFNLCKNTHKIKLVELPILKGMIFLDKYQAASLAGELTYSYLFRILNEKTFLATAIDNEYFERFNKAFKKEDLKVATKLDHTKYPPCIKLFIEELSNGLAITHFARFTLAAFMRQIGVKKEHVKEFFNKASNFNSQRTEYQISHIYGEIGSRIKYSAPSCDTLKVAKLCPIQYYCDRYARHPVAVYKRRMRQIDRQ
jgi:DNA primase large subunit